ncbi:MAG: hypothetical protein Kow00120_04530 [Anaerolineae bacterium]
MKTKNNRATLERWADRIESLGLAGVGAALVDAVRPLAPVGAGLLWATQPLVGALFGWDRVSGWANALEDPDGLSWLGARLAGEEPEGDE